MRTRENTGNISTIACERALDRLEAAALAVARVLVDARADHEIALVGLADVSVHRVRHHDRVDDRLDRLGHQRLQRMAFDRQADAGHVGEHARVAGGDDRRPSSP